MEAQPSRGATRRRPRAAAALLLSIFAAAALFVTWQALQSGRPNIILISIDTLRHDHLGLYGYEVPTSPHLDAFSEEAFVFSQAIAQAPATLGSHAAMLTSQIPTQHGASWKRRSVIRQSSTTLAETLQRSGYRTAGFHGGGQMSPAFGLGRGLESYELLGAQDFSTTVAGARSWIEESYLGFPWLGVFRRQPFFLFLHNYHVHHPYTPRAEHLEALGVPSSSSLPIEISVQYLERLNGRTPPKVELGAGDLDHIIRSYDAEIRGMDEAFGRLIAYLRESDLYDDTLIVFTSDHGEEFGERGLVGWHGYSLFDELIRIPLLMKPPRGEPRARRIARQVRGIDIMPTLLEIAGVAAPESATGTSLWSLMQGRDPGEPLPAISQRDRIAILADTSVRTGTWKYVRWNPGDPAWNGAPDGIRQLLFDLAGDPGEKNDLSREETEVFESLREIDARVSPHTTQPGQMELSEEIDAQLRALGYVK